MAPNDQLKAWITLEGISNAEAARRVDYDRSNFHRILEGTAKPTIELAHRIESATGGKIAMEAWVGFEPSRPTPAEQEARAA